MPTSTPHISLRQPHVTLLWVTMVSNVYQPWKSLLLWENRAIMGQNKDSEAHAVTSSGTQRKSCGQKKADHIKMADSTKETGRAQVFALRWVPSICLQKANERWRGGVQTTTTTIYLHDWGTKVFQYFLAGLVIFCELQSPGNWFRSTRTEVCSHPSISVRQQLHANNIVLTCTQCISVQYIKKKSCQNISPLNKC